MVKAGTLFVQTRFLTDAGIRRTAGQYRTAVRDGKLSPGNMPGIDDGDDAWQRWVRGLPCTCAWVPVYKSDIHTNAWGILVSDVWSNFQSVTFRAE